MEIDSGAKPGVTSNHADRLKTLERENRELKGEAFHVFGGGRITRPMAHTKPGNCSKRESISVTRCTVERLT